MVYSYSYNFAAVIMVYETMMAVNGAVVPPFFAAQVLLYDFAQGEVSFVSTCGNIRVTFVLCTKSTKIDFFHFFLEEMFAFNITFCQRNGTRLPQRAFLCR